MNLEYLSKNLMIEKTASILIEAGLTFADFQIFNELQENGFSIFVHGSVISGNFSNRSDVDFAVVGDFTRLPAQIRNNFLPEIDDSSLNKIDYISTSISSQKGIKMSLHIEKSQFRKNYPNILKPYSLEYRPAANAKKSGLSKYFFRGIDRSKKIYLMSFVCPQESCGGGMINTIPQTGLFRICDNSMTCIQDETVSFETQYQLTLDVDRGEKITSEAPKNGAEIMLLGLEYDKMKSDAPLFYNGNIEYVAKPLQRVSDMIGQFMSENLSLNDVVHIQKMAELLKTDKSK